MVDINYFLKNMFDKFIYLFLTFKTPKIIYYSQYELFIIIDKTKQNYYGHWSTKRIYFCCKKRKKKVMMRQNKKASLGKDSV